MNLNDMHYFKELLLNTIVIFLFITRSTQIHKIGDMKSK